MPLTATEQRKFTADQLTQINRLGQERLDELLAGDRETRSDRVDTLASRTVDQLRARVNVLSIAWGEQVAITYASENDYTSAEQQAITDTLQQGDKWLLRIPEIVSAGSSLAQRVATLEAR